MRQRLLPLILLTGFFINAFSQENVELRKNVVSIEILGSAGLVYNLTYERLLKHNNNIKILAGIGFQYNHVLGEEWDNIVPQINLLIGQKHHFETGVGIIYYYSNVEENIFIPLRIGYRYQKKTKGIIFKAALTPLFTNDYKILGRSYYILPWAGIAIGYSF